MEHLIVQRSRAGNGLFAGREIGADEVVMDIRGESLTRVKAAELATGLDGCIQIDFDKFLFPEFPFNLVSHCCQPNCGITSNFNLIPLRAIRKGEEITWDYSTAMLLGKRPMVCNCGSLDCREVVTDFDLLPLDLQERYIKLNVVLPFIVNFMLEASSGDKR